jgi:hypothetical protein
MTIAKHTAVRENGTTQVTNVSRTQNLEARFFQPVSTPLLVDSRFHVVDPYSSCS